MRDNLLWFGFVFFAALSASLLFRQFALVPRTTTTSSTQDWLQPVSLPTLCNHHGEPVPTSFLETTALIVADTRHACNACLLAEAEDWQAFLQKHSFLPPATVLLICDSPTPKRTFRELEALGVRFPILFDTTGQIFQALNSRGSLEVFFLYRHRVLCRYEPNVGNRALTQAMQKKFRDFIALSAGQRGRLI